MSRGLHDGIRQMLAFGRGFVARDHVGEEIGRMIGVDRRRAAVFRFRIAAFVCAVEPLPGML